MYKNIQVHSESGYVYVGQFENNVGASELVKAITVSNPGISIADVGIFSYKTDILPNSLIIIVTSKFNATEYIKDISKAYPGVVVQRIDEFSAYSDAYEAKHKKRDESIKAGFDYNGFNYQIDSSSRLNIVGKALELQLDTTIESVNWISNTQDENGNDIVNTFTREEFIDFAKQVASYYESIILNS